jgi:hypothetical protein
VSNNNCHPTSGRGANIDASYVTISNNTFNVTELKQNAEYGGCEIGGGYGIRFKFISYDSYMAGMVGDVITGNKVTVTAGPCTAIGIQFVLVPSNGAISVTGNTITTLNLNQGAQDYGVGYDASYGQGIVFSGNTVTSTTADVYGGWDGYNNIVVGHNTWLGKPAFSVVAGDGGCDPTVSDGETACPASLTVTDTLPDTASCTNYSEATVTIAGHVTRCKANH